MSRSKIEHKFQKEILVPWGAISNNIEMSKIVETSDNILCSVVKKKEVHLMSDEANEIIQRLYSLSQWHYLILWYKKLPSISTLWLVSMELKQVKVEDEESIIDEESVISEESSVISEEEDNG
jgi:hypothetical protein